LRSYSEEKAWTPMAFQADRTRRYSLLDIAD